MNEIGGIAIIEVILHSDFEKVKVKADFGEKLFSHILSGQINHFESYKDINLMSFEMLDTSKVTNKKSKLIICLYPDKLIFICFDNEQLGLVKGLVNESDTDSTHALYSFFSLLLADDAERLEDFEDELTELDDAIAMGKKSNSIAQISQYRKHLLTLKRYYEQIDLVFDGVDENGNGMFSDELQDNFDILNKRLDKLLEHITNLRDYIMQIRDAYQSQLAYQQNNLIKVFTVVTTITLPINLITGWYGMNIIMPEFKWEHGYMFVIGLSILIIGSLFLFFKRKKWF